LSKDLRRETSNKALVVRIDTPKICRWDRSRGGRGVAAIGEGMVSGEDEGGGSGRSLRNRKKASSLLLAASLLNG